jgi:hypothetical protein
MKVRRRAGRGLVRGAYAMAAAQVINPSIPRQPPFPLSSRFVELCFAAAQSLQGADHIPRALRRDYMGVIGRFDVRGSSRLLL